MTIKSISEVSEKELESFFCGNHDLDNFLRKHALNNEKMVLEELFC